MGQSERCRYDKFNRIDSSVRPRIDGETNNMSKTVYASIVIAGFFLLGALLLAINGNLSMTN